MAYICEKPKGSCTNCEHYRFDDEYGGNACFAAQDAKIAAKKLHDESSAMSNSENT